MQTDFFRDGMLEITLFAPFAALFDTQFSIVRARQSQSSNAAHHYFDDKIWDFILVSAIGGSTSAHYYFKSNRNTNKFDLISCQTVNISHRWWIWSMRSRHSNADQYLHCLVEMCASQISSRRVNRRSLASSSSVSNSSFTDKVAAIHSGVSHFRDFPSSQPYSPVRRGIRLSAAPVCIHDDSFIRHTSTIVALTYTVANTSPRTRTTFQNARASGTRQCDTDTVADIRHTQTCARSVDELSIHLTLRPNRIEQVFFRVDVFICVVEVRYVCARTGPSQYMKRERIWLCVVCERFLYVSIRRVCDVCMSSGVCVCVVLCWFTSSAICLSLMAA